MSKPTTRIGKVLLLSVVVLAMMIPAGQVQAEPKNVIFFIGDGMGPEQVKAGNYYLGGPLSFELFPYNGVLTTYSADATTTDSAAAGTALATGVKVNNGVISMAYPGDHSELETLLEYSQTLYKSTGLVTTTYMAHATPAAFGAHEPARGNYTQIANDYLTQTKPNVLFGGNSYMSGASGAGYTVVSTYSEMSALATESYDPDLPTFFFSGQFGSGYMPYEFDGDYSVLPHLSEMTATALAILDNDADGFFLMVEGGRIDHAGHLSNSDPDKTAYMVWEVIEFANAVQVAIDWAAGRNDTLILITADHETGGLTVTGDNGAGYYPSVSWGSTGHTAANVPVYAWGENAELVGGVMDNTDMFGVVTATLSPEASNPSPADDAAGVDIDADLGWTAGAGAVSHDVYFGTDFDAVNNALNPNILPGQGNQSETTYEPGTLVPNTTYYWAIDERDSGDGVTLGAVWSFTTAPLPGQADIPSPADDATDVGVDSDLSWTAGIGAIMHQIYFAGDTVVEQPLGNETYDPGQLLPDTMYSWRIDEVGPGGVTEGIVWSFTTVVAAPGQASSPSPDDGAESVAIDTDLSWTAGAGATSHDVYFGMTSPGTFQGNQIEPTFDTLTMANNTTYYWRVDEKNAGGTTTGTVWSFTTAVAAPGQASSPSPADTATDVSITTDLSWTAGSDAISHDVYFCTDYHDVMGTSEFQGNQTGTTYEPGLLNPGTPYYWRIDEKNASGTTTGEVWSFTTTTAETAYDAYVSQEPLVTFGTVVGTIQGTIEAGDDLVQEITEVPNGRAGMASLEAEYLLHTTASPVEVTGLTLYMDATWTALDGTADPLLTNIMVWNGTSGWEDITGDIGNGSFVAPDPQQYIDGDGNIRLLFTDTTAVKKEKKDTLTVDLLYAHISAGPVDNAPLVTITEPVNVTFDSGSSIAFAGAAIDTEDGDLTDSLTWESSINTNGPIGTGGSFTTMLSDGVHVITAWATDSGGKTGSASISITVGDPPPAPPTGLTATAGNGQVSLDWDDSLELDLAGYNVYRLTTEGDSYTQIATLPATSNYLDESAVNETTYYYVVTAVDSATPIPNESGFSNEVSATPTAQVSDLVTIIKAEYRTRRQVLTVQATSSQGGVRVLTVVGYGEMTYTEEGQYTFRQTGATDPGVEITVVSDLGGSATATVIYR